MEGQRYQIRLLVRSSCGEGRFWLPRRADTIWIQASHSVLAERSLFLASQTTTNSAATPGHWGQPRAFLQSKDEEEREVGNRQWKSKHPSQLRHRDERPVPAAETPAVIMLATRFIHVSFCFIRPSFVFHSFHWFQSCFIRAISVIPKGLRLGENLRHGRGKEGKERGKERGESPGSNFARKALSNPRRNARATDAFYDVKQAGSSSSKSMSFFFPFFPFPCFLFFFLCFFFLYFFAFLLLIFFRLILSFFILFSFFFFCNLFFLPSSFSGFFGRYLFFSFLEVFSFSFSHFVFCLLSCFLFPCVLLFCIPLSFSLFLYIFVFSLRFFTFFSPFSFFFLSFFPAFFCFLFVFLRHYLCFI